MKYVIPVLILVLVVLAGRSVYVVGEGHAAVTSRFGKVEATGIGPGLHFRLPYVQHVAVYDARQIVSQAEPETCKTRDGKSLRVGFYLRWQVADPVLYYQATSAEELQATQQMRPWIGDALRQDVAGVDLADLLTANTQGLGTQVREAVAGKIRQKLGIRLVAVDVGRVLPPDAALAAVYKRMNDEATAHSDAIRSAGEAVASAIRAQGKAADQQVLATTQQAAAAERGEGDADAAKVYAAASATDPGFFRYWSALETWRKSFARGDAVVVLDKDSPFMQAVDAGAAASGKALRK